MTPVIPIIPVGPVDPDVPKGPVGPVVPKTPVGPVLPVGPSNSAAIDKEAVPTKTDPLRPESTFSATEPDVRENGKKLALTIRCLHQR
jgi:hypothetical protein